ncbi:hypothetical protein JOF56_010500 [Kibdelosporangium banguiense]|uniref:DUF5753 domain-containing protein n=1 Tax=Kibdelosporangium banguiense TaxID=1365924 RepID=A0ABS4U0E3_9PSEU|nr:hypothetical protein [Kibdelosporangium banguiense]
MLHSFLLIEFPQADAVTYIELVRGRGVYLSQGEVAYYSRISDELDRIALSARESRDILRAIVREREG